MTVKHWLDTHAQFFYVSSHKPNVWGKGTIPEQELDASIDIVADDPEDPADLKIRRI